MLNKVQTSEWLSTLSEPVQKVISKGMEKVEGAFTDSQNITPNFFS